MFRKCTFARWAEYVKFAAVSAAVLIAGCATQQSSRSGGSTSWSVSRERLAKAAYDALVDPQTWIPAAGALAFRIDSWDSRVSDRASSDNPIFGSQTAASNYSDVVLWSLIGETVLTGLYASGTNDPYNPDVSKSKYLFVEGAGVGGTAGIASILQSAIHRRRPNGNPDSFPSGHTAASFAASTMSNRSLDSMDMSNGLRTTLQTTNVILASSVAWARVESQKHYPSDVLAGAALGHFFSAFIYDSFLNQDAPSFHLVPYRRGVAVSFEFPF